MSCQLAWVEHKYVMRPPPLKHPSAFGVIKLRYRKQSGTLVYEQKGGNQSSADRNGVSLDAHVHALFGLVLQTSAKKVLMIGCAGGTLGTMLACAGKRVTVVDIDKVSFKLAKRYFGLPKNVACHVGDGLAFMQNTRKRFDVVILDAFIGENIPEHLRGDALFAAVKHCLRPGGAAFVNVCLNRRGDPTADNIAQNFKRGGWPARLLDSRGSERNAVVLAGAVRKLRRPKLLTPPLAGAKQIASDLAAMRFRRRRR